MTCEPNDVSSLNAWTRSKQHGTGRKKVTWRRCHVALAVFRFGCILEGMDRPWGYSHEIACLGINLAFGGHESHGPCLASQCFVRSCAWRHHLWSPKTTHRGSGANAWEAPISLQGPGAALRKPDSRLENRLHRCEWSSARHEASRPLLSCTTSLQPDLG